ncbi:MAG: dihydrofolate reductase [Methylococcales bacterium]
MKISIIAAVSSNYVIGFRNHLPWHLPEDLRNFKRLTMGKPILMGRRTFESLGRVLPGRVNIVVTRNPNYRPPGCRVFSNIADALQTFADCPEMVVIGGASFYEQMLPFADTLYLTVIDHIFYGDAHFPWFDTTGWIELSRQTYKQETEPYLNFSFLVYRKINIEPYRDRLATLIFPENTFSNQ